MLSEEKGNPKSDFWVHPESAKKWGKAGFSSLFAKFLPCLKFFQSSPMSLIDSTLEMIKNNKMF